MELEARWNQPSARYRCFAHNPHPVSFNLGKPTGGEWASSVLMEVTVVLAVFMARWCGVNPRA